MARHITLSRVVETTSIISTLVSFPILCLGSINKYKYTPCISAMPRAVLRERKREKERKHTKIYFFPRIQSRSFRLGPQALLFLNSSWNFLGRNVSHVRYEIFGYFGHLRDLSTDEFFSSDLRSRVTNIAKVTASLRTWNSDERGKSSSRALGRFFGNRFTLSFGKLS